MRAVLLSLLLLVISACASGVAATGRRLAQRYPGPHGRQAARPSHHSTRSKGQPFRRLFQQAAGTSTEEVVPIGTPVALINQEVFHYEVVAGYMHLLQSLVPNDVTVYLESHQRDKYDRSFGFSNMVLHARHLIHELPCPIYRHQVLIFVSPEYHTGWVNNAIKAAQPKEVIIMVHNGDTPRLAELLKLHDNMRVVTLAPHVLHFLEQRHIQEGLPVPEAIKKGAWMLPSWEWQPAPACPQGKLHDCLSGFSIQGKIEVHRRNYTHVFDELRQARLQCTADAECTQRLGDLRVTLLGAQEQRLPIPEDVKESVKCMSAVQYHDFYQNVYRTYALVPALGQKAYYDRKMSSTVISSLITGTPMIVTERMQQAFPFLSKENTIMQPQTTSLAEMLVQVLDKSEEELAAVRAALTTLRDRLNAEAQDKMKAILAEHGIATTNTSTTSRTSGPESPDEGPDKQPQDSAASLLAA